LPQVGSLPLVQYNTRTGTGSFVIGTLPAGVQATLTTNVANKTIDLVINSVGLPRWEGLAGGNWDINITTNWVELSTGLPTKYTDGAPVLFDDQALGTTTVNLVATVNPTGVNVTNSLLDYTLVGAGKITGNFGLTKRGTSAFTIANAANEYTGATVISGGTLAVTNLANSGVASAIGRSSAAATNLTLAGGTLAYSGPATAIDRGYSVQGAGSTIDTVNALGLGGPVTATTGSSFRKTGAGPLIYRGAGVKELSGGGFPGYNIVNGAVLFDGSGGGQTNHSQNEFWVGGTPDTGGNLVLSNTVLNVDSWFAIGRGNGTLGNVSTTTLYDSRLRSGASSMGYDNGIPGNLGHSILTLNGSSTFTNAGDSNFGESSGSLSEIFLNGNSVFYGNNRMHVGWHAGATGAIVIAQSAALHANAWFSIGHEGGVGSVLVKDNGRLFVGSDANVTDVNTGEGLLTLQDNASLSANQVFVAKGAGSFGTLNQTGGSVVARGGGEFHIGARGDGTYNLIAGTVDANTQWTSVGRFPGSVGTLNVSGGIFRHNDAGKLLMVGEEGTGTMNVSGTGVVSTVGDRLSIGQSGGAGVVNLNGGTIRARRVGKNNGTGAFNFNGGVLEAGANAQADFMSGLDAVTVQVGGAIINSAGQNIGINQDLLDGGGNGGLTKQGAGALYLNGLNTYTGPTTVSAGTLGGSGTIAGSVTIGAGATLAPGTSIGTLTVITSLTLGSNTVMEVSKDGDVASADLAAVTGNLAFGGALTVVVTGTNALAINDTFNLFDWGTRSGTFTSTNLPANYTWDLTQLAINGTIRVTGVVSTPTINAPVISGGNLIFSGTGGTPGGTYTVLTSTNIALPAAQWTTNTVGTFNGSGAFSNALPVSTSESARFYRLRIP
jgi:fibronectin-binding autotransporter adhesin